VARLVVAVAAVLLLAHASAAQDISGRTLGPLTVSGEMTATVAPEDDAYFNQSTYDANILRAVRVSGLAGLQVGSRLRVMAEAVSVNVDSVRMRGLYVRVTPLTGRALDVQAGRVPPVFGSFARRAYGSGNALIGVPLAYQYLTIVRADSAALAADGLLARRGDGWAVRYPLGDSTYAPGLPVLQSDVWDTGIEVRVGREPLSVAASVTQGTLSAPRLHDDNGGKQAAARVQWIPRMGLILGASGARGEYGTDLLAQAARRPLHQAALGADAEYSWDRWIVRAEAVWNRWDVPLATGPDAVDARSLLVEGVRTLAPRLHVAARAERLGFSEVQGTLRLAGWDAPVTRVEGALSFEPWRPLRLRVGLQRNWRDDGPPGRTTFVVGQAAVRF
jgi:hypothetical protein